MKKTSTAILSVLVAGAAYAACVMVPSFVLPLLRVSATATPEQRTQQISDHISRTLGSARDAEILVLRIPVQVCALGICGHTLNVAFLKPCGEDAAEAYRNIARQETGAGSAGADGGNAGPGWGSGGNGGGAGWGGGGGRCPFGCADVGNIRPL